MKRDASKRKTLNRQMKSVELRRLGTEKTNSASVDLDRKSALEIARIINHEDSKVAAAVKKALLARWQKIYSSTTSSNR